jgi:hypothetical protein
VLGNLNSVDSVYYPPPPPYLRKFLIPIDLDGDLDIAAS